MKKNNSLTFALWLASPGAVAYTLAIGVIFLITNYSSILYLVNPDRLELFKYPFFIQVAFAHLDSLFFGLATAIIIFQSNRLWLKGFYCLLESIMVFLNVNRTFLTDFGYHSQFLLGTYIAVFSGFTLFFLGFLAKQHVDEFKRLTEPETSPIQKEYSIQDASKWPSPDETAFDLLTKYPKTTQGLKDGLSLHEAAKLNRVSKTTASKIRTYLKTMSNGVNH